MTYEEYKAKLRILEKDQRRERDNLLIEYAESNNTIPLGSIIESNEMIILVDKIKYSYGLYEPPYCVYHGVMLTKKLIPFKNGERCCIRQNNNIKVLNKE